jgi:hypothetical protein
LLLLLLLLLLLPLLLLLLLFLLAPLSNSVLRPHCHIFVVSAGLFSARFPSSSWRLPPHLRVLLHPPLPPRSYGDHPLLHQRLVSICGGCERRRYPLHIDYRATHSLSHSVLCLQQAKSSSASSSVPQPASNYRWPSMH